MLNLYFIDVTDQIQAVDVTEEMRGHFESQAFRDQLLAGRYGMGGGYDDDEYEEYEDEEYFEDGFR